MAGRLPWIQPLLQMQLLWCNFSNAFFLMQLRKQLILNPKHQARSASLGGGADSDSISNEIDAEDVGAIIPWIQPLIQMQLLQRNFSNTTSQFNSGINQIQKLHVFYFQETTYIYFQTGKYLMYRNDCWIKWTKLNLLCENELKSKNSI